MMHEAESRASLEAFYERMAAKAVERAKQSEVEPVRTLLEFRGERHTVQTWADRLGVQASLLRRRLNAGWTVDEALGLPLHARVHYRVYEFEGQRRTLRQWAEHLGMSYTALIQRFRKGWPLKRALTIPVQRRGERVAFQGERLTVREWADRVGMQYSTVKQRLSCGWSMRRALTEPLRQRRRSR